jgi:hypothetical protein
METLNFKTNDEVIYNSGYATIKEISNQYHTALILCPLISLNPFWVSLNKLKSV